MERKSANWVGQLVEMRPWVWLWEIYWGLIPRLKEMLGTRALGAKDWVRCQIKSGN